MIVVADASVLVGELLRKRGRELLLRPELQVLVAEDQWSETQHELSRRLGIMESAGRLSHENRRALEEGCPTWTVETLLREVEERETIEPSP